MPDPNNTLVTPVTPVTVVTGIFINKTTQQFLLLRRAATSTYPGMWCFPGGRMESGETILDTLVRECQEEVGVTILLVHATNVWTKSYGETPECPAFNMHSIVVDQALGTPIAKEEGTEVAWVDPEMEHFEQAYPLTPNAVDWFRYWATR